MTTTLPALTVWYNTRCPVCDAGIRHQKRRLIEAVKAGRIAFRDINLEPDALAAHGAALDDVRRRLHATEADGRVLVGADVAIAIWRATPGSTISAPPVPASVSPTIVPVPAPDCSTRPRTTTTSITTPTASMTTTAVATAISPDRIQT